MTPRGTGCAARVVCEMRVCGLGVRLCPAGLPSGRSLLPESLDAADEAAAALSPAAAQRQRHRAAATGGGGGAGSGGRRRMEAQEDAAGGADGGWGGGGGRQGPGLGGGAGGGAAGPARGLVERALEDEFFATVGRSSEEVGGRGQGARMEAWLGGLGLRQAGGRCLGLPVCAHALAGARCRAASAVWRHRP
jgi:hypothetical protein